MDRKELLSLLAEARHRAEAGDLQIADQHAIISDLENRGLDSVGPRVLLSKLIDAQETDLIEMERLLDEMERETPTVS